MKNLVDDLASLRKIVGEMIPHTTDLLNENTRLKEWGNSQEQMIDELKPEITRLRKALEEIDEAWQKMPGDKDADEWTDSDFEMSNAFAKIMNARAALAGTGPQPVMEYRLDGEVVSREEAERLLSTVTWIGRNADLDVPGSVDSAPANWFILQWDYKAVEIEGQKE